MLGRLIRALAGGFVPARAAAAPLPLARTQDPHSSCGGRSALECRPWQPPWPFSPSCTSCSMRTWRRCVVCDACLSLEFNLLLVLVLLAVTSLLFSRSFCVNSQNSSHIPLFLSCPLALLYRSHCRGLSSSLLSPPIFAIFFLPSPPLCLSLSPLICLFSSSPPSTCDRSLHVSPSSDAYPR